MIINPTKYWIIPKLQSWDYKDDHAEPVDTDFNGNAGGKNKSYIPSYNVVKDGLEFDQGKWSVNLASAISFSKADNRRI